MLKFPDKKEKRRFVFMKQSLGPSINNCFFRLKLVARLVFWVLPFGFYS